ncbi:MAG: hypothetical protein Salg2KO_10320 [Salibacteraceae bacterium]
MSTFTQEFTFTPKFTHLSGSRNGVSINSRTEIEVIRSENVLDVNREYKCAMERFQLKGALLPVFDANARTITVTVENKSTEDRHSVDAEHSQFFREVRAVHPHFLYELRDVAVGINDALEAACTAASVPGVDIPTFQLNRASGDKFEIVSNSSFRGAYDIIVNEPFEYYFTGFYFIPDANDDSLFYLDFTQDTETQISSSLEFLSPIASIAVEAPGLPVVNELVPAPNSDDENVQNNNSSFLVDFLPNPSNQGRADVQFEMSAYPRWHSMIPGGDTQSFRLVFSWYDFNNERYDIIIGRQGSCKAKLYFEEM